MSWKTICYASALVLGFAASAQADEAVGKITAIDATALSVTLDDGNTYDFGLPECRTDAACALPGFQVGDQVTVVYDMLQDKRMGRTISPVHN